MNIKAVKSYHTYRYNGSFEYIYIGANSTEEALKEVARSLTSQKPLLENLEKLYQQSS
jgi:hypothetical protein